MSKANGLPDSWQWSTLSEACEKIQDGTHFSPSADRQLPHGPFPYVTAKNVRPSGLDLDDLTYLAEVDHRVIYERCDPLPGDVLLVKDGVNTGDAAINTVEGEISLLSSVCMLRTHREVLASVFLRYYLLSPQGNHSLTGQMTGTAIKRVILRKIRDTPVPIAPLNEQGRIAVEIDELLSDLDAGVAALRRAKANLKRYRAAVLKAAVEGKLTAQWRAEHSKTEPASRFLDRMLTERCKTWQGPGKYKEAAAPDSASLPPLPEGWTWASLEQVARSSSYGTSAKCSRDNSGPPVLRIPNIAGGRIDLTDLKFAGTGETIDAEDKLAPGDLLIIRTNGSKSLIGRSAVVRETLGQATGYASYLIRFRLLGSPTFFDWVGTIWDVSFLRAWIEQRAATSAGQHNISMSVLNTMPVPLPPLAEQEQILAETERRLRVVQDLDAAVSTNLLRSDRLRQSILRQAFQGKLVPQDPKDEPASVLLDRLRQSRTSREHVPDGNIPATPGRTRNQGRAHRLRDGNGGAP